jgi:hypothetical protein
MFRPRYVYVQCFIGKIGLKITFKEKIVNASFLLIENDQAFWNRFLSNQRTCTKYSIKCSFFCRKPNKKRKRSILWLHHPKQRNIACDFSLYWTQIHQLRFIHALLYLSRKKGIRVIHLKEALFNIATKTAIFVEKNVITCNMAVTKYQ